MNSKIDCYIEMNNVQHQLKKIEFKNKIIYINILTHYIYTSNKMALYNKNTLSLGSQALNIVYLHWILPSNVIREQALKKLQRWWRRASGENSGYQMFYIMLPNILLNSLTPPILYRQHHDCRLEVLHNGCINTPCRQTNHIQHKPEMLSRFTAQTHVNNILDIAEQTNTNIEMTKKLEICLAKINGCGCTWKPPRWYECKLEYAKRLWLTEYSSPGTIYTRDVYIELSRDSMTPIVRYKTSRKLWEYIRSLG